MRSSNLWGPIVAAACAGCGGNTSTAGCGGDNPHCYGQVDASKGVDGSDDATGQVQVTAMSSNSVCATVNPLGVGPENAGTMTLSATINAPDDAGVPSFLWTATNGNFSDPQSRDTTFRCTGLGPVTVTFTVSSPGCDQSASATLRCTMIGAHD